MEQIDFGGDGEPQELSILNLNGHDYVLREAKGDAVIKFQEAQNGSWEKVTDETTGKTVSRRVKPAYRVESLLVSLCLFDLEGRPVPQAAVEAFKPSIVQKMYVWVMEKTYPEDDVAALLKRREALTERIEKLSKNLPAAT